MRALGFADISLEKFGQNHQDSIIFSHDLTSDKPRSWTQLANLVSWSEVFLDNLTANRSTIAILELMKGSNEFPISKATFNVDEARNIITSATNFEASLGLCHPDTKGDHFAIANTLIDDSVGIHEIMRQVFSHLFMRSAIRLIVKSNLYYSCSLVAFLVDLMHQSGASPSEVKCLALERRDSVGSEMRFIKCISSNKNSKLSVISAVFKQTDTFAAAHGIIEAYFREQYPNLIVLVEEAAYERFVRDWQRYYSHAVQIGSRLDARTTIVDSFNSKVQIDLNAIDIKQSHKMSGYAINILKFRTLTELTSLLANLRRVPIVSLWNDDVLLLREFCLRINVSHEFWLNHIPNSCASRRFPHDLMDLYAESVAPDMTDLYNSVAVDYGHDIDSIRKLHTQFMKKDYRLRTTLVIHAFSQVLSKSRSLRNGLSLEDSVTRLRRFHQGCMHRMSSGEAGESRVETIAKPIGLAIIVVREELATKSKAILVEFVFKNLLIGNGVLLVSPNSNMEAKLSFENDHVVPFKQVCDSLPDMSRLSLDASIETQESSPGKKQCPKNTFVVEMQPDMSSDTCEAITLALGVKYKCIYYPDADSTNYWSNES